MNKMHQMLAELAKEMINTPHTSFGMELSHLNQRHHRHLIPQVKTLTQTCEVAPMNQIDVQIE